MAGGSPGAASRPFSPLFVLGLLAVGLALGGHRGAQGERGAGRSGTSSNMAAAASARGGAWDIGATAARGIREPCLKARGGGVGRRGLGSCSPAPRELPRACRSLCPPRAGAAPIGGLSGAEEWPFPLEEGGGPLGLRAPTWGSAGGGVVVFCRRRSHVGPSRACVWLGREVHAGNGEGMADA